MLFLKRCHFTVAIVVFTFVVLSASNSPVVHADDPRLGECHTLLEDVSTSERARHWSPPSNVFSETLPITLLSTVAWLSTVEAVRQAGFHDHPALTSTFVRTVPIDATLSTLSHAIALGHLPWLKRFLSAEGLPQNLEFWARTGTNGLISTAVISTAWAVSGIPMSGEHLLGAFTLCAGVYPVLQKLKNYLFRVFPNKKDLQYQERLQAELPVEMESLTTSAQTRGKDLGLREPEIEALFLSSLEALITSKPYEDTIENTDELREHSRIQLLVTRIKNTNASISKKMKLRRSLINELLKLEAAPTTSPRLQSKIASLLGLGAPFDDASSLAFHRVFRDRYATYRTRIIIASFLDQAFAVGLAGGVFLYSTTYWAAHGQWPW